MSRVSKVVQCKGHNFRNMEFLRRVSVLDTSSSGIKLATTVCKLWNCLKFVLLGD